MSGTFIRKLWRARIGRGLCLPHYPLYPQWRSLGPFGGDAALVQVDPHIPGTIVAGASNGLIFRSQNSGESWDPLPFPPRLRSVLHTLVINPTVRDVYL